MNYNSLACLAVAAALAGTTSAAVAADELKLATDKGCTGCHAVDKKVIGPAYKDVAKKYKGDAKAADTLTAKVLKGGQGVWGPIPMPPNDKVTPDEVRKLVGWVLSL